MVIWFGLASILIALHAVVPPAHWPDAWVIMLIGFLVCAFVRWE